MEGGEEGQEERGDSVKETLGVNFASQVLLLGRGRESRPLPHLTVREGGGGDVFFFEWCLFV